MQIQARGTAEGLVDGERVSIPVELVATSATGVYALRGEIPDSGSWVLVIRAGDEDYPVTAIVDLGPAGARARGRRAAAGGNPPIPREVTGQEIDARLRSLASAADGTPGLVLAKTGHGPGSWPVVGVIALGLAGAGLWGFSRKR